MASPAQLTANRINAQSSTGPTSVAGKLKASQNAVQFGLFSKRDIVPDDSLGAYTHLRDELLAQLNPESILEEVLAREIVSASWRLERCAQIEANLDTSQNEADTIARARTAASRVLWKSMDELRKIQNERCIRRELADTQNEGLASRTQILKGMASPDIYRKKQAESVSAQFEAELAGLAFTPWTGQQNEPASSSAPAPVEAQIARNAPCPCGSGEKYKRCCGAGAPPKLAKAA